MIAEKINASVKMYLEDDIARLYQDHFRLITGQDLKSNLIVNKSSVISAKEIGKCIQLLHKDYHNLGIRIFVFQNKFQALHNFLNPLGAPFCLKTIRRIFRKQLVGLNGYQIIHIYPFNYPKDLTCYSQTIKLLILETLYHELRHSYQDEFMTCVKDSKYIDGDQPGYFGQKSERDARHFATRMMNKFHDDINDILGIKFKWESCWGRLEIYE
ncbi:hypothetical protein [Bacillus subtilis]|uniref:hypothetical protein n=1 Tax=Bacillus subtilis TaxID=1423 RepID=UPI000FFDFCE2|nr:hypothetical protein [Bacillus subtilis]NCT24007.1 hypothetical protein [Bacillus subtilis subsp. subtilis]MEC2403318.1 hypothetical protein [Bacillus subtilis]MED4659431.1 hypothetical protein [Bacillus subtilis]MED4663736.1 hypothetical protein [Bacillus subtilis]QAT57961.1 hypothetical protein EQW70_11445 [Bacillus subtilis]